MSDKIIIFLFICLVSKFSLAVTVSKEDIFIKPSVMKKELAVEFVLNDDINKTQELIVSGEIKGGKKLDKMGRTGSSLDNRQMSSYGTYGLITNQRTKQKLV